MIAFAVTPLQAVAMLLFNERPGPLLLEDVREALGTDIDVAKRVLHSLSCQKAFKVLAKTPESNTISPTDTFAVNAAFTHSLRKVRIAMASLEDTAQVAKIVDDQR